MIHPTRFIAAACLLMAMLAIHGCGGGVGCIDGDRPEPACPPTAPYGVETGSTLPEMEFQDCQGSGRSLHVLCGANAGLVYHFYGWCSPCYEFIRSLGSLADAHRQDGLKVMLVVAEDPLGKRATTDYCASLKEHFGLDFDVVIDPAGAFAAFGTAGTTLVSDENAKIVFKRDDAPHAVMMEAIEEELARSPGGCQNQRFSSWYPAAVQAAMPPSR